MLYFAPKMKVKKPQQFNMIVRAVGWETAVPFDSLFGDKLNFKPPVSLRSGGFFVIGGKGL